MNTDRRWERPTPVIGDTTSAAERAEKPDGWALPDDVRSALDRVIGARRDIRRYRPEPVPEHLVRTIIDAGHAAPSVGHSQPWRFIIVDDPALRDKAAVLADVEKLKQAELLTPDRKQRLLDLQLDGIKEAPLGIVVACDRRTPASGVLGRNTFVDTDLWSCAAAIENMWLTARAYGLGMGWVTLFRPDDLAELLHLPEGIETLGWMCLGWPDERPPSPGLERRAWSKKLPVENLIMRNGWREGAESLANAIAPPGDGHMPDQAHVVAAHDSSDQLLTPPGSLGILDTTMDKVAAVGDIHHAQHILIGADHPVTKHGVSSFSPSVTREIMDASTVGESLGVTTAAGAGIPSLLIDAGVDGDSGREGQSDREAREDRDDSAHAIRYVHAHDERGDIVTAPALSTADTRAFIDYGRKLAGEFTEPTLFAVGEVGIGNTTPASILAAHFTGLDVNDAVGIGAHSDTSMMERKREVAQQALSRVQPSSPIDALAEFGGPEFAVTTGLCLGALDNHHVVVLDGLAISVAALAAVQINPAVQSHLAAGHVSREIAHRTVITHLGLEPLLALRFRCGEGVGAVLATQMIMTGLSARRHTGRTA